MIKQGYERTAMVRLPAAPPQVEKRESKPWESKPQAASAVRPARSREADVVVPALQAAITGVVGGALAGLVALGLTVALRLPWPVVPAAIVGGAIVAAAVQWMRGITSPRVIGMTRPSPQSGEGADRSRDRLTVEYVEESPLVKHWEIDDLPVSREVLARVVRHVASDHGSWSRRSIVAVPGIGSERARRLIGDLVRHRFLHYPNGRNHPDGAQPTAKGSALFRALTTPPLR